MKTSFTHTYVATFIIISMCTVFISTVQATVGGPTFIGTFTYNPADESVYYVHNSQSGRGCPPVLQKISLATGKVSDALSCTQGEELIGDNYTDGIALVRDQINQTTNSFKNVTSLSLPKNDIRIDVNFVRSEKIDPTSDWIIMSHFMAQVYQNSHKVAEFPITGCNLEQPFTFAGYAVPGFEKKIVLLSSTKGDCFEGGYLSERLHVVGGLDGLNTEDTGQYKSDQSGLIPNESTRVVFEPDTTNLSDSSETASPFNKKTSTTIILIVIALGLGIVTGRMFRNKNK